MHINFRFINLPLLFYVHILNFSFYDDLYFFNFFLLLKSTFKKIAHLLHLFAVFFSPDRKLLDHEPDLFSSVSFDDANSF